MGAPMARNIAKAGHDVRAWNRSRHRAEPLAADGITIAGSPRLIVDAGRQSGVKMDLAAAGAERFRRAALQGHGDEDIAATYYASFDS